MTTPTVRLDPTTAELAAGLDQIRADLHVPGAFPPEVRAAAASAAATSSAAGANPARADHTDIPFLTIDPAGSRDLDQALFIEKTGSGHRVWYAIADVAAFVVPGGPLDTESWARGVTFYCPDRREPLYPDALGEGAASLLAGEARPALLWRIDLAADGTATSSNLTRATVQNRQAWSYVEGQDALHAGAGGAPETLVLLQTVGEQRIKLQRERGGVDLDLPEQQVVAVDGRYELRYRASVPMEAWNAQISLLAGMEAARIMLAGGVGVLRTVPPPLDSTVRAIRRSAHALGFEWPKDMPLNEFLASVDRTTPHGAALVTQAARAFRGAGYETVDRAVTQGGGSTATTHSGVAAPYAHVTAPLRRLGDRYANEIVVALCAGVAPPSWATERLGELPSAMGHAQQREHALERAIVDYVETMVLRHRIGDVFDGTVTNVDEHGVVVQVAEPAVLTRVSGVANAQLGDALRLRLVSVDPEHRSIDFEPV